MKGRIRAFLRGLKKPYLKKICDIENFSVWFVDGQYIRTKIDEEFTNFGQHYRFNFIPDNEFWIDRMAGKGEEKFYIDHLLVEQRLMASGKNYSQAIEVADKIEKRERTKEIIIKRGLEYLDKKHLVKKVKKKLVKEYSNSKVKVWIVDGELVRSLFFIDFTEGGHDKVYKFVPEGEIWIDNDISVKERNFVLLHEAHERNLMSQGQKYPEAHRDSSRIEFFCRHHPATLNKNLERELKAQN
jgi:hypothetical protein